MKNVYVLPTDKSSRVSIKNDVLVLHRQQYRLGTQNIYITSDEEIKEGDWTLMFDDLGNLFLCDKPQQYLGIEKGHHLNKGLKKIILTTDQDLIKNGVQAIDDEFLEWFVKNPSCGSVEVVYGLFNPMGRQVEPNDVGQNHSQCVWKYKIIIPKEEPKKELPQLGTKEFNDLASAYFGGKNK